MRRELARKTFHVASAGAPVLVLLLPRPAALAVLGGAAAVAVAVDLARLRLRGPRYHFLRRTRTMLRARERRGLTGATWMAVAYALAAFLFPAPVAAAAMLFNALGDAAAALVGKRWGRHRTSSGKSWEGFAAAAGVSAVAALVVGWATGGFGPPAAVVAALAAAVLEMADLPIDDNLRLTLGGGAVLALAAAAGL